MIRHPQTTSAQARFLTWMLVVFAVLLPGTSFQKRYHCQVTGARDLLACCCTGDNDCAPEISSCDSGGCCPSEEEETSDDCGCCEITFARSDGDLATAPQGSTADGPALRLALLPAHEAASWLSVWLPCRTREKVPREWTAPPVYLLNRSFLI